MEAEALEGGEHEGRGGEELEVAAQLQLQTLQLGQVTEPIGEGREVRTAGRESEEAAEIEEVDDELPLPPPHLQVLQVGEGDTCGGHGGQRLEPNETEGGEGVEVGEGVRKVRHLPAIGDFQKCELL